MTPLRHHLDQARSAHHAATYAGDLAADVLSDPAADRSRWRIGVGPAVGASALIAASIAVLVFLRASAPPAPPGAQPAHSDAAVVQFGVPRRPEMPRNVPIVPPYHELSSIPAKPSFPSRHEAL
jgi:hypothetical protein